MSARVRVKLFECEQGHCRIVLKAETAPRLVARTCSTVWRGVGSGDDVHMLEGSERLRMVEEASSMQDVLWWLMLPPWSMNVSEDVRRSGDIC